jgi:hypothetical protein
LPSQKFNRPQLVVVSMVLVSNLVIARGKSGARLSRQRRDGGSKNDQESSRAIESRGLMFVLKMLGASLDALRQLAA